jgi:integrase
LLLAEGVHPKVVQEQLGHSTAALTLDTCSHVAPSLQAEAAARLERLLGANCQQHC